MERLATFSQDEERLFVRTLHAALAAVRSRDPRIFDHRQSKKINGQRGDRLVWLYVRVRLRQARIQICKRIEAELVEPCGCFLRIEVLGSDALIRVTAIRLVIARIAHPSQKRPSNLANLVDAISSFTHNRIVSVMAIVLPTVPT